MNAIPDGVPGVPMLRLPAGALPAIHRALAHGRSAEEAATLLREIGFEAGEAFRGAFAGWLDARGEGAAPEALPADRFWPLLGEFFSSLGWGELELVAPHPGVVALTGDGWAEATAGAGASQPSCHLTTGLLSDLLGRVAGTDLAVMEVECRSRGNRECRFLIGGPQTLESLYGRLREGASAAEAIDALG